MTEVNTYKVSMTYQSANPQVNPVDLGIDPAAAPSTTDQVLDLSGGNVEAELTGQDLSLVKTIKVGTTYLAAPDAKMLKSLVDQIKSVSLDAKGKLRPDFQFIFHSAQTNPAAKLPGSKDPVVTTNLVLNIVGPEPNDGYKNTTERDMLGGIHLIQPGDNLTNIARSIYGGSEGDVLLNAQRLARFNGFSDPNKIPSGKNLYLIDPEFIKTVPSKIRPVEVEETPVDPATTGGTTTPTTTDPVAPTTATDPATTPEALARGAEIYTENPPTLNGLMKFIGKDAMYLIENYEKTENKMYWDGGAKGKGYPTTGIGHLIKPGEKLNGKNLMTATLTRGEIEQLFMKDLRDHVEPLIDHLKPEVLNGLNRNQLTALASLAFNIGPGGVTKSGYKAGFKYSQVTTTLNNTKIPFEERLVKAADGFSRHIFSKGQRMQGLISRRMGERVLFIRPDVKPQDVPGYDRPALKAFVADLNKDEAFPDIKTTDMWPPARPRTKKK